MESTSLVQALTPLLVARVHQQVVAEDPSISSETTSARVAEYLHTHKVKILAQFMNYAHEVLQGERLRTLHWAAQSLTGYDEWREVKAARRQKLRSISLRYLSQMRFTGLPTTQGTWFYIVILTELESFYRETQILRYTSGMLPPNLDAQYQQEVGQVRDEFFAEDAEMNIAIAQWTTISAGLTA